MKQLVCIGCPKGCNLTVDEENNYAVSGNGCEVGARYGKEELTNPTRVITTTVRLKNSSYLHQLPVKSSKPISKSLMFQIMEYLKDVEVSVPIDMSEIIVENILDTSVDIVACREVKN